MNPELKYFIALSQIYGVGVMVAKQLISFSGGAKNVFELSANKLKEIPGIGSVLVKSILNGRTESLKRAELEIEFLLKHNINATCYTDSNYPKRLSFCNDAPLVLFHRGNIDWNYEKVISIVGTRKATKEGKKQVEDLLEGLAQQNVLILSGLAYGIDIHAHKNALKNRLPTACVLAHSLDTIYPLAHLQIAEEMCHNGGMITEFISGTKPDKQNFPRRNRIVAGMADAVIVVESTRRGGSMITAEIAHSYNREVFAFPGRASDKVTSGCNFLIKTNRATLIENANDLMRCLGWEHSSKPKNIQRKLALNLSPQEQLIVDILQSEDKKWHIDELSSKLQIARGLLISSLLGLELQGIILSMPGSCYEMN